MSWDAITRIERQATMKQRYALHKWDVQSLTGYMTSEEASTLLQILDKAGKRKREAEGEELAGTVAE